MLHPAPSWPLRYIPCQHTGAGLHGEGEFCADKVETISSIQMHLKNRLVLREHRKSIWVFFFVWGFYIFFSKYNNTVLWSESFVSKTIIIEKERTMSNEKSKHFFLPRGLHLYILKPLIDKQ